MPRIYTKEQKQSLLEKEREIAKNRAALRSEGDVNYYLDHVKYKIIYDSTPVEEGGFKPGAKFDKIHIECMVKRGSLKAGSVFINTSNGNSFIVRELKYRKNSICGKIIQVEKGVKNNE